MAAGMKPLGAVIPVRLGAAIRSGPTEPFLLFDTHLRTRFGGDGAHLLLSRSVRSAAVQHGRLQGLPVQSSPKFQTLQHQLLDSIGEDACAVFDVGPEIIAPKLILPHGGLQRLEPEVEARETAFSIEQLDALEVVGQKTGDRHEADGGFGMQDMQDNAGGTAFGQVPIVFLAQNAMKPGVCAASLATEGPLRLGALVCGQDTGGDARGLMMQEEEREQESVDDIAMEAKTLLFFVGAGITMERTKTKGPVSD